jgi:glycyl-tRNA synthetase alpha chain
LERISQFIQGKDSIYDLEWAPGVTYGDIRRRAEFEFSRYNFEAADVAILRRQFEMCEAECSRLVEDGLVMPAYDHLLRCSHTFNTLDARRAISVAERTATIARIRGLARKVAGAYLKQREEMGFPMLNGARGRVAAGV